MEKYTETYHAMLAKSYIAFFMAATVGLLVETFFPIHLAIPFKLPIAIICFALGSTLILWAQYTSRHTNDRNTTDMLKYYFYNGPYKYMRNPTQLGLIILILGYAIITASFTFFIPTYMAYIVSNYYFRKYEAALKKEYGDHYAAYQANVKKVL